MTAACSISPLARGSRPTTATRRAAPVGAVSRLAAAAPRARASSAVSSRLATPRTPSVPNSRPMARSALAVLRGLAGLLQSVLLALDLTRVAGQEAGLLEHRAVLRGDQDPRPGDRQAQRPGLPGRPAAVEVGVDVDAVEAVHRHQRRLDQLLVDLVGEVVLQAASVEVELAGAGHQPHPGDGLLAPPDGLDQSVDDDRAARGARVGVGLRVLGAVGHRLGHWVTCLISYGTGCWAVCGCSGPA